MIRGKERAKNERRREKNSKNRNKIGVLKTGVHLVKRGKKNGKKKKWAEFGTKIKNEKLDI